MTDSTKSGGAAFREVLMLSGSYAKCREMATSIGGRNSLDRDDVLWMWNEDIGDFIAVLSMGCWCQAKASDILEVVRRLRHYADAMIAEGLRDE